MNENRNITNKQCQPVINRSYGHAFMLAADTSYMLAPSRDISHQLLN